MTQRPGTARNAAAACAIERLRGWRAAKGAGALLAGQVGLQMDAIVRRRRALGAVGAAWASLVPAALAARVRPESVRRGVLLVRAADSAAGFEFDRWVRAGGMGALRGAGVRSVRAVVGDM